MLLDDQQPYYRDGPPGGWTCCTGTFFSRAVGGGGNIGSIIVAGDGYAYVGYGYAEFNINCPNESFISHVRLLRIGSDGSYSKIGIQDVAAPLPDGIPPQADQVTVNMISNADTGVLVSWSAGWIGDSYDVPPQLGMAITTGTSLSPISAPAVPGQSAVVPVLQLEDGSFVGAFYDSGAGQTNMIAFDVTGAVRWSVANEQPQIATADGGVIGQSGITYDHNGSATGVIANLPTQSWLGNDYQYGSVEQVAFAPFLFASTFAAFQAGNPSKSRTYVPSLGNSFRATVASVAKSYVGNSSLWAESGGGTTCNLFVRDCLRVTSATIQVKIPFPVRPNLPWYKSDFTHPFLAADWANPDTKGAGCWKILPAGPDGASPGDVIATGWPAGGVDGTGHVGIVVAPDPSAPNYKDASAASEAPYFWSPAQKQSFIAGTITLTDYGFRLPGFDPSNPQNVQGLKQDSHVRRFSCY